ncbi:hypothetical protein GCM10008929_08740 [Alkalibacterium psychrotolerans]
MKKIYGLFLASALFLGACNSGDSETTEDETEDISTTEQTDNTDVVDEEIDSEATDSEMDTDEEPEEDTNADNNVSTDADDTEDFEFEELDEQTQAELDQDWENIDWENIRLTRAQFDAVLYEVQDNLNVQTGEDGEQDVYIENIDFDGETIEITLINNQLSEIADFATGMYAWVIDSFYRQLYLSSEYSNWEVQPRIIIIDQNGEVITDQMEFITFEE